MSDTEKDKKQINEPEVNYSPPKKLGEVFKTITVSSFEEMENNNRQYWAQLTYEERLQSLNSLLMHFFKSDLEQNPGLGNRIYFT